MSDHMAGLTTPDAAPFRRLHPLSILMKSATMLGRNIIAIVVLHFSLFDQNLAYTAPAALALVALVVGVTALIWSRFTYQVTAREIRIKSGLLNRNNRSIPFDRIQDVSLEQTLFSRLIGLMTVKLETGAGGGDDGQLDALARPDAEGLRDTIRDYKAGLCADETPSDDQVVGAEAPPLFAMDNRRILIAGLFNFSFVLFAIFGAVAQNLDFLLPDGFFDPRRWIEALPEQEAINSISSKVRIIGAMAAISSLVTIGLVSGIVATFVREYGFRLDLVNSGQPGFRRRRGLFTRTDMVMPIHRVQAAVIQTGPLRERFGWYHLKFISLASDANGETDHSAAPCARLTEIEPILDLCKIHQAPLDLEFQRVNPAFWWRKAVIAGLLITAIALGTGFFLHPAFQAISLLALPVILILFLNWQHHQYALDNNQMYVRSGWWRRKLTILPFRKIQSVDISQSPLDHPLDLATVTIGIAGGSTTAPLRIHDIPLQMATDLRAMLVARQNQA
ncbi:PH domain-containing protein [Parasphingorhabdus sp.]|uniref:PH domain-containing protein n=1 Tax=Parasphingorhabdus sp. TaxID=2709688 RepID=UPI003A9530A1